MEESQLLHQSPFLYHMAHRSSWPSIRTYGLLSTSALLDLYGCTGENRRRYESDWRRETLPLDCPGLPTAYVRDQKPMEPSILRPLLLDDMEPEDWYRLLNGMVFFWPDEKMGFMMGAYRDQLHLVLKIPTGMVLERARDAISLSPINSGSTRSFRDGRPPEMRGRSTFQRIPYFSRRFVKEIAIQSKLDRIEELHPSVSLMKSGPSGAPEFVSHIWPKPN